MSDSFERILRHIVGQRLEDRVLLVRNYVTHSQNTIFLSVFFFYLFFFFRIETHPFSKTVAVEGLETFVEKFRNHLYVHVPLTSRDYAHHFYVKRC
jgi:hypothetical protein